MAHSDYSGYKNPDANPGLRDPGVVQCASCGHIWESGGWMPRIRCPNCDRVGYPDRAWTHLLSLEWECAECGHSNEGNVNFCMNCAAGLTSRCLHCESPVYGAACTVCGFPQEPLIRRRLIEGRRQEWVPILSYRVQQEIAKAEAAVKPRPAHDPAYGVTGWRSIAPEPAPDPEPALPPPSRPVPARSLPSQPAPRRRKGDVRQGLVLISLGIAGLVWTFWESISAFLAGASLDAALMTAENTVVGWWSLTITPGIAYLDGLEPNSPAYVVLLISAALGILLFPILIYGLNKLVHRLFP